MNFFENIKVREKRIKLTTTISYIRSLGVGIFKILMAIFSKSLLMLISSFYNFGIGTARLSSIRNVKKDTYTRYLLVGNIVAFSSIVYMIYSIYILCNKVNARYHMYVALAIAIITFADIGCSIYGIVKARKRKEMQSEIIKFVNLANALISLSITETAILSFTEGGNIYKPRGISGIVFGALAFAVGIYMILYVKSKKDDISRKRLSDLDEYKKEN
jgi:hypothetical protein